MNEIATTEDTAVWRPSAALNPERLEYLWRLTDRIAWSTSVPESLRGERKGNSFEPFDDRTVLANVFAVVEQADRWNVSPFALLGSAAIVRGKLAFEGKAISAVLEAQFGVKLYPYFRGEPRTDSYHVYLCDEELPDEILAELKPGYRHDRYRIMDGSVGAWKTTANGSPWRPDTYGDMLIYRGTRQWARVHKASAILGVIADDEALQISNEQQAMLARDVTPIGQRFAAAPSAGFSPDNLKQIDNNGQQAMETGDRSADAVKEETGAQREQPAKTTAAASEGDKPTASEKPSSRDDGGAGANSHEESRPQESNSSENSRSSSQAADDSASGQTDGSASSQPGLPRSVFEQFSGALGRVNSEENVEKAKNAFFKGKGLKLTEKETSLFKQITQAHVDRVKSGLDVGKVMNEIKGWIEADVPEDPL